jgi:hypothetical protein
MMPVRETIARSRPLWLVVLLVAGIALGCRSSSKGTASFEDSAIAIEARTVPPGSTALVQTGPVRGKWDVRWELEFETGWDWETYKRWVRPELEPEFRLLKETEARLTFGTTLDGDAQTVILQRIAGSGRTRIQVSITNYPD